MGPAALPGARRRPVPRDRGQGLVVTDQIETFTETGIKLESGASSTADIVVTATGLSLQSGRRRDVHGRRPAGRSRRDLDLQGHDVSDVPNLASVFGYINASWTLKADLACEYVCRLLNHMDRKGTGRHAAQQ